MKHLVFLLEEESAKEMLQGLLPKVLEEGCDIRYIVFEGKQDLDRQLVRKLRGYRVPRAKFIVLRDKDSADCKCLKTAILEKCREAGRPGTLVRIACHEIESWYLADLAAVDIGLDTRVRSMQTNRKYQSPDNLANAAEELEKLTNRRYQKISGSRSIGPHLDPDNSRSRSFSVFMAGLRRLISD